MGGGERWLVAGFAPVSLDGVEQGGLLAADVGASAVAQFDVEGPAGSGGVAAEQTGPSGRVDCCGQARGGHRVLAPDVKPSPLGADGQAGDGHGLNDGEGVAFHQYPVLKGARFGLVGVAHQVVGSPLLVGHGPPFDAGGEGGSAPPQQSGGGDLGDDPVVSHR